MATRPLPEAAEFRFAPYIEELHEFFATSGVRFGAPEDIPAIMDRLRTPGTFSDDLSSLVRSFVLRQGGAMPHAQLMEILAFAIGGPEMARSPQQYREPLRELLGFVSGVMRRPFNVLPGDRLEAEVVPFPRDGNARGGNLEPAAEVGAVSEPKAEADLPAQSEVALPMVDAEQAISRSVPIPIAVHEPVREASTPPLVPDDPLPPHTPSDPIPAPEPTPAPEPIPAVDLTEIPASSAKAEPVAPMSAISAALAAESERSGHAQEPIHPVARTPEAEPGLGPMLRPVSTATVPPKANEADVEPRRSAVPREILIAGIGCLVLAAVLIITYRARQPGEVYTVQPANSTQTTHAPAGQAALKPSASSTASPAPYASGTANPAKPSAYGPQLTGKALRRARQLAAAAAAENEDIAQPYSSAPQYAPNRSTAPATVSNTQPATGTAHPLPIQPQPQPNSSPVTYAPYNGSVNGTNSAAPVQAPAPIVREPAVREPAVRKPRDPDATIVGDSPAGTQFMSNAAGRTSSFTVSSGVMAANLISSPSPEYPTFARIAHIQGQVILQAVISKDGTVSNTRVLRGNRLLRGAAEDAVRRWRYRPYRVNGRAVDVATIVTVDFHTGG